MKKEIEFTFLYFESC